MMGILDERIRPQVVDRRVSADGARKYLLRLSDGNLVETVGIPHGDDSAPSKLTVCFSTQVGCAMGCAFCATGKRGIIRNLEAAEMLWQISLVEQDFGCPANSAIAMGQGEPLANYDELVRAIEALSRGGDSDSNPKVAISTCGLSEGIRALASEGVPATLAVSLHSATQELRDRLMPGVRHYPLDLLHAELADYCRTTGNRVVVQYLMLDGVNDGDKDLEALASFCEDLDACVSLLHFNSVEGIPFAPSTFGKMVLWSIALNARGIETGLNKPRGADISAACGQLASQ